MSPDEPWLSLLDRLDHHLDTYKSAKSTETDRKAKSKQFVKVLEDVCTVVRDAERKRSTDLPRIVEKAQAVLDGALRYAHSPEAGFPSLPTFAHSEDEPLVEDALEFAGTPHRTPLSSNDPH